MVSFPSGRASLHRTRTLAALLALGFLAGAGTAAQAGERADRLQPPVAAAQRVDVTDRLIIKYRSAAAAAAPLAAATARAENAVRARGAQMAHLRRLANGAHVFRLDRALPVAELARIAEELRNGDGDVDYAEPDLRMQPQFTPNDALYGHQWPLFEAAGGINAPTAWDKSTGAGVVVAVLDTGVHPHADLQPNLLPGFDFVSDLFMANDGQGRDADAADPGDWTGAGQCYSGAPARNSSWHGTHVAGTVAAATHNGLGVAGVAFGARILPVRVLGRCGGYSSDIADGIVWAAGGSVWGVPANPTPARVLNLSLGGSGSCGTTYQNAIASARARGAVVVVAAGNANIDAGGASPASCPGVVTVAAVGRSGGKASYSNWGAVVDLAAPGGDSGAGVPSTLNAGTSTPGADSYAGYMGTSMATPHVAGVAALMLARNPALTPDEVESRLKATARAFPAACTDCGTGIVDANAAVDAAAPAAPRMVAEVEPNGTLGKAQPLSGPLPLQLNGSMRSSTDLSDYASFAVPAGATLRARLQPNAASNYDLLAYTASGTLIASSRLGTGEADELQLNNPGGSAATVVLRVRYLSGLTGSGGTYTLTLSH